MKHFRKCFFREYFIAYFPFRTAITMVMKGKEIRFIGGKYGTKKGWINTDKEPGENTIPVIVNLGKKGEWETYVFEENVADEPTTRPSSYAEAVIQQCPDLDQALTKLARDFAKCSIHVDPNGFFLLVQKKVDEATKQHEAKGSKALYRNIKYTATTPRTNN
jgi:hypothetical protein